MKEHGRCAKCKKSVGCPYADDRITGCKNFVLEPELKLTNEESLRQYNTEQLAEMLANESKNVINDFKNFDFKREHKEFWEMWLKQPHTEKE